LKPQPIGNEEIEGLVYNFIESPEKKPELKSQPIGNEEIEGLICNFDQ